MNELVPLDSGMPSGSVQLFDRDWNLVATKPEGQSLQDFIGEHVKPGDWRPLKIDRPDGRRWTGRAEVKVEMSRDYEHLKKMAAWPEPPQG
ncbi:hypothetical protein [Rhodococcus qingshengii]|uniref:hypothetical protein n=1 Tax=Rhodococcus qingshengii TaxID=334542 RepID=UPI0035D9D9CA